MKATDVIEKYLGEVLAEYLKAKGALANAHEVVKSVPSEDLVLWSVATAEYNRCLAHEQFANGQYTALKNAVEKIRFEKDLDNIFGELPYEQSATVS